MLLGGVDRGQVQSNIRSIRVRYIFFAYEHSAWTYEVLFHA